jgi:hypothetical protein
MLKGSPQSLHTKPLILVIYVLASQLLFWEEGRNRTGVTLALSEFYASHKLYQLSYFPMIGGRRLLPFGEFMLSVSWNSTSPEKIFLTGSMFYP